MKKWDASNIPDLTGKVAIVTGGNIGLGYEICLQLTRKNAHVIVASRNVRHGEDAVSRIKLELGKAVSAEAVGLDLIDIQSVRDFASTVKSKHDKIDVLINNAGVVNLKNKETTTSGLEMHMATNHYGHFALAGLLYPLIKKTSNARVVTISSGSHKFGNIDFGDLNWEKRSYDRGKSYGDSKLANLLFAVALQERFNKDNSSAISVAAHPGLSATKRQQTIGIGGWLFKVLAQPVWKGALPALRAATDPDVQPCEYYGPQFMIRGYPMLAKMDSKVFDKAVAKRLWDISEQITGVRF